MTDEKERVALLPCPFCGGKAVTTMAWQIRCDNKDCALCFYTMSERQWNTRAQKQQVSGDAVEAAFNKFWDTWYGEYRGQMPVDSVAELIENCKEQALKEAQGGTTQKR